MKRSVWSRFTRLSARNSSKKKVLRLSPDSTVETVSVISALRSSDRPRHEAISKLTVVQLSGSILVIFPVELPSAARKVICTKYSASGSAS